MSPTRKTAAAGGSGGSPDDLIDVLAAENKPPQIRARMLKDVLLSTFGDEPEMQRFLAALVTRLGPRDPKAESERDRNRYREMIEELERGPLRPATFIRVADGKRPTPLTRVAVVTPDGHERYPVTVEDLDVDNLDSGMTVFLDAKGGVVLEATRSVPEVGACAEFLRRVDHTQQVEVRVREDTFLLRASRIVLDATEAGTLKRGGRVLVSPTREFAFRALPAEQDRRYRFVDRSLLPEVDAGRDIGKPHWVLPWLVRRTRILLFRDDLLERFELRPRVSVLMTGPSGVGKTLHLRAFLREFKLMLERRTGRRDIGSRVIRAKLSELLSEWLGRSDKNFEALFDDIYHLASEGVETANGERLRLPVVVVLEEVEALGRRRGGAHDGAVYDRILGTLLQRLDDPTHDLSRLPLILISTSNRADLIDAAMIRRLGSVRAHFGRLDRAAFAAVLGKKIKASHPFASLNGHGPEELRRALIDQVVAWFYSPSGEDTGVVEITLADGKKLKKHRREFLTGALVEQAVSQAMDRLVFGAEESDNVEQAGFSAALLIDCFCRQVDSIVEAVTPHNIHEYVDVPEHTHVAMVRRLEIPRRPLASAIVNG